MYVYILHLKLLIFIHVKKLLTGIYTVHMIHYKLGFIHIKFMVPFSLRHSVSVNISHLLDFLRIWYSPSRKVVVVRAKSERSIHFRMLPEFYDFEVKRSIFEY